MAEVSVSAHWEDRVSPGIKDMAQNVGRGAADAQRSVGQLGTTTDRASEQLRRNSQALLSASTAVNDYRRQFDPARTVTEQVTRQIEKMGKELGLTTDQARRFASAITEDVNAGKQLDQTLQNGFQNLKSYRAETLSGRDATNQFGAGVGTATDLLTRFLGPLTAAAAAYKIYNDVLKESISLAVEAETSQLRLKNILEVTGRGSAGTAASINAWAASLANLSGVSDEAISNMVSTAIALGQNEAQARKLAEAAVVLHNRLGRDVDQSFQELIQTLDGSAGRFAKLIPGMDQATESMLKQGKAADIVIHALGSSEAEGVSGAWHRLQNAISEDKENLGKVLTGAGEGASRLETFLNRAADAVNALNSVELPSWFDKLVNSGANPLSNTPGSQLLDLLSKGNAQSKLTNDYIAKLGAENTVELPPGFVNLQAQMAKALESREAHEHDFDALFNAYLKAFDPAAAASMAHDAVISGTRLSDVEKALAKDLEARREAENNATKSAQDLVKIQKQAETDWANLLSGDAMKEALADLKGQKQIDKIDLHIARREPIFTPAPTLAQISRDSRSDLRAPESDKLKQVDAELEKIYNEMLSNMSKQGEAQKILNSLASSFSQTMGQALTDLILGARSLNDIARSLIKSVAEAAVQTGIKAFLSSVLPIPTASTQVQPDIGALPPPVTVNLPPPSVRLPEIRPSVSVGSPDVLVSVPPLPPLPPIRNNVQVLLDASLQRTDLQRRETAPPVLGSRSPESVGRPADNTLTREIQSLVQALRIQARGPGAISIPQGSNPQAGVNTNARDLRSLARQLAPELALMRARSGT